MMELEINGTMYGFKFGMGFLREINGKVIASPGKEFKGGDRHMGLRLAVSSIVDRDVETLVDVLLAANKGLNPRVTKSLLDEYIDSEDVDIDMLFDSVIDFLSKANATKSQTVEILKAAEKEKQNLVDQGIL